MNLKKQTISGFIWRFLQNISTQVIQFVLSIILARILMPEDYGLVAMVTVFTNIALVFINVGFTSSVVQKRSLSQVDLDTIFYCGLATSGVLYLLLYLGAPMAARFYHEPRLAALLRAESVIVVLGSLYSVPQALFTRNLEFKKSMAMSLGGVLAQALVGILLACRGFGAWALVLGTVSNFAVCTVLAWALTKWRPRWVFSWASFREMFYFSITMLLSSLLDTVFNNIRALIIGRQYSGEDLAYYNRGYQFPTLVMGQVDGAITTVLFASLSRYQDDWENGLRVLRRAMRTSLYLCVPAMIGLCAVAEPLILVLLTEKWAGSIIYVRLCAILCITWPLSSERHALNALGRSDISFRLNVLDKGIILASILCTYRISVEVMIISTIIAGYLNHFISMFFYRKYLHYKLKDQVFDILPPVVLSLIMGAAVFFIPKFLGSMSHLSILVIQVTLGAAVYIAGSILSGNETFYYLLGYIRQVLRKN